MAWANRLGTPGCSARRTYEGVVKPYGSTVKKEVRIEVESWEKIWGYVGGVGEFEKGKGPKKFLKIGFFEKRIGNVGAAV